jgi:hypothetical protein
MVTGLWPALALRAGGATLPGGRREIPDPPRKETFDSAFLSELEGLVTGSEIRVSGVTAGGESARGYREALAAFLAPLTPHGAPLNETSFLDLSESDLGERGTALRAAAARGARRPRPPRASSSSSRRSCRRSAPTRRAR